MTILYHEADWPLGIIPSPVDKGGITRVRQGADGGGAGGGISSDAPNFWDIITNYCFLVGAIPYFRGRTLIIRPSAAIFDQSKPQFADTYGPFNPTPRVDDQGNPFTIRKFIYGNNLKELSFERKYNGVKAPVIQVNSFDTSSPNRGSQKLLSAQWPPKDAELARVSGVLPSGEVSQSDIVQHTVSGVRDVAQLLTIAKNLYEEIGSDPDICRIRPGDAVEFLFDTRQLGSKAPGAATILNERRKSFDEQVKDVVTALSGKSGGGVENLARVIVASSRSIVVDMLRVFRVANVVFNWSVGQGLQTQFDFQNYFVVRSAITPQLGANVGPPVSKVVNNTTRGNKGRRKGGKKDPGDSINQDDIVIDSADQTMSVNPTPTVAAPPALTQAQREANAEITVLNAVINDNVSRAAAASNPLGALAGFFGLL
jgi:hypothetical protein